MKTNISKIVGAGILSTALASGQIHGDLNAHISQLGDKSNYIRTNAFYNMPLGTKGYTFIDLNKDGTYFGKTFFTKNMGKGLALKTETKHLNEFHTQTGVGIEYAFSKKDTAKSIFDNIKYAKVNYLPKFVDKKGETIECTQALGYSGAIKLPWNTEASSFGQVIMNEDGANWAYGEAEAIKKFGNKFIGINAALIGKGGIVPDVKWRATAGINF